MRFGELDIAGVWAIDLAAHEDGRGYFMRTYDSRLFAEHDLDREWLQENEALTAEPHTIRGIHIQLPPDTEAKLVRVTTGAVFEAYVDLRRESPTFGRYGTTILSAANRRALYIPRGVGLAMCTLEPDTRMLYKHDRCYAPQNETEIRWDDPDIGIQWPLGAEELERVTLSERDAAAQSFREFSARYGGIDLEAGERE